ncbi:MAG: TonB-dependent receptor [Steroidobacteraceae bacterium]
MKVLARFNSQLRFLDDKRTVARPLASRRYLQPRAALLFAVTIAIAAPPSIARADESATAAQSTAGSGQLEEITVTARRRAEPLQQVPVAVSVMTGPELAVQNLNDIQNISNEIPSVEFRTGASNKDRDIFIRGIGTITTSPGVEPSVSTVIDGVVLARPGQATLELLDVDRIEVLRGPQGTLFGKNAAAGVVNIVTTDPTQDFHGYADGGYYGGGDEYRFKGGVSGTLIQDKLTGLISAVYSHYNGNVDNLFDSTTVNGYERYGGREKLLFTPTDNLRVTFAADYLQSTDTVPTGVPAASGQLAYPSGVLKPNPAFAAVLASEGVVPSYQNTNVSQNVNSHVKDENGGTSITTDYSLAGGYTLTSITAYRKWQNDQDQDYDQISTLTPAFPAVEDHGYLSFYQVSEEARIASPKGQFIDYQAGVYYLQAVDTELYQRNVVQLIVPNVVANYGSSSFGTHADNYSVFGEANFNFTDSLRAILGARAIRDTLAYTFDRFSSSPVAVPAIATSFASTGSTNDNSYTDRVGLEYDFSPDIHSYATYSRGYTGPAYNVFFNMAASATSPLKPETSNDYEIGLKSRILGDRLQINVAGFITNFDNYQANFTDVLNGALVTRLINAGQVSTRGVEADVAYKPIDNLTFTGAGTRDNARVENFNCPPQAATSCNINGQPLPFAPDWKFNIDGNYVIPLNGVLNAVVGSNYRWQSKVQYQLTETPDTIQGSYGIWDARLSLTNDSQGWRVTAVVNNIANKSYSSYLAHGDFAGVMRWVPRDNGTYGGIEVHKSF